jgi:uncharacterized membrane protein YgaE (UPF0421/DUF939 family)
VRCLRTAKATLSVVTAYLLAGVLHLGEHPIVAPLMALLMVQLTLCQTLLHGLRRPPRQGPAPPGCDAANVR